jgi:hypothetical protein
MTTGTLEERARQSLGTSHDAIHAVVHNVLAIQRASGILADVGCGTGSLSTRVGGRFTHIVGIDAVRFDTLPEDISSSERQTSMPRHFRCGTAKLTPQSRSRRSSTSRIRVVFFANWRASRDREG